jgi:UDP-3-O-[3-hydroxymyristoyl] glucosamine N-acyltransferase
MKKYELTDETLVVDGHKLYRIKALRSFSDVKKGDLGGYVKREINLSHNGDCWVSGNAKVFGNAIVYGNAKVHGNARVSGDAWMTDNVQISGNAHVSGNVGIYDKSIISGNCILNFNAYTYLKDIILDHGVWTTVMVIDNKTHIISNTLEKLYIGDIE